MEASTLASALGLASGSLHNLEFLQILTHFCFEGSRFYAWDDKAATIVELETGLNCALRGDALINIVKTFNGEVKFVEEDSGVRLRCGRSTSVLLPALSPRSFVFKQPAFDGLVELELTPDIVAALDQANDSVNKDSLKQSVAGVTLYFDPLQICATDNTSLVSLTFPEIPIEGVKPVIIPKATVTQLIRVYEDLKSDLQFCTMRIGANFVQVDFVGKLRVTVVSKLIKDKLFDYPGVIEAMLESKSQTFAMPDSFDGNVTRAAALVGVDAGSRINFTLAGNRLETHSKGQYGQVDSTTILEDAPGDAYISVDPKQLARFTECGTDLQLNDGKALIISKDDGNKLYMIAGTRS